MEQLVTPYQLVRFHRDHLLDLLKDGLPGGIFVPNITAIEALEQSDNCFTLLYEGLPVGAGGTIELWPNRHQAWAMLPEYGAAHLLPITRYAYEVVRVAPGRVEMQVIADFMPGRRWAMMLGFQVETPLLRAFGPDGKDYIGYVLFNGD